MSKIKNWTLDSYSNEECATPTWREELIEVGLGVLAGAIGVGLAKILITVWRSGLTPGLVALTTGAVLVALRRDRPAETLRVASPLTLREYAARVRAARLDARYRMAHGESLREVLRRMDADGYGTIERIVVVRDHTGLEPRAARQVVDGDRELPDF